jgi:hypothetical protein
VNISAAIAVKKISLFMTLSISDAGVNPKSVPHFSGQVSEGKSSGES